MRKVLITGGTGFLGRNLACNLISSGFEVHLLVRGNSDYWRFSHDTLLEQVKVAEFSLGDRSGGRNYLRHNEIDSIIHLATFGSYPQQTDPNSTLQTNLIDSLEFLWAAIDSNCVEKFISAGSASEYSVENGNSIEDSPLYAPNIYGRTKASFGLLGSSLVDTLSSKMHFTHLRFFSIYGPFESPSRVIPRFTSYGINGKYPPLSKRNVSRDFIYVDDCVDAVKILLGQKISGVFNISSGYSTQLHELATLFGSLFKIESEPNWDELPSRNFDYHTWSGDNSRAYEIFGWRPQTSLEVGIEKFSKWVNASPYRDFYKLPK